jgi:hypothetical protein
MAPRTGKAARKEPPSETASHASHALPGTSPEVAVKCDLCDGRSGGPACVASCPTQAIARINPSEVMPDVRAAVGRAPKSSPALVPRPSPAWPWIVAALPIALAAGRLHASGARGMMASGVLAGLLVLGLVAYGAAKRWVGMTTRTRMLRPWFVAHVTLGVLAAGAIHAHAGFRVPSNAAGALALALWTAVATGLFGAVVYRLLPPRLSRIERGGALPEDLAPRARALEDRAFRALTGKSELVKTIYARILRPYLESPLGAFALFARGHSLAGEQRRLRARIDQVLARGGAGGEARDRASKLQGTDELVRLVVERRAIPAQVWLHHILRAWLPVHLAATAIVLVLLALHAALAVLAR